MMQNHPPPEELFAYRDGELEMEKRGLIEAHVLSCSACQTRLDEMSDAEGMLRQGLQDPSAAYFDQLTGSVMARVTGTAPAAAPNPESREPKDARAAEPPREHAGRRRSLDDGPRGRAPGLPWPAIISAASAAAAVVVVVVMLVQRQDAWRGAAAPPVAGVPGGVESREAEGEARRDEGPPPLDGPAKERAVAVGNVTDADKSELPASGGTPIASSPPAASTLAAKAKDEPAVASREEEVETQSAAEALPEAALQKTAVDQMARVAVLRARADAAASSAPIPGGPEFAEVAARFGLPLLFDPARVPGSALLRAEPDLRLLYQTGRAGADSARVRLYLAESARERGAGSFDAETFDTIVHHYRRAIVLARDVETARMARKRLEDFVSRNAPGE